MKKTVLGLRKQIELTEDLNKVYSDYYSGLNREDFDRVIALDPTFNPDVAVENNKLGQYGKWLLTRFKKGGLDEENATEVLSDFDARKKYLKNDESKGEGREANKGTDINAYKSIEEVKAALDCIALTDNQRAKIAKKQKQFADLGDDAVFIGENDEWEVWRPLTYAADAKLGEGSTWCTASSSGGNRGRGEGSGWFYAYTVSEDTTDERYQDFKRFYRYHDNGKLYVFLNKNDKHTKYQARVGDESREVTDFMDVNDSWADFKDFIAASGLLDVLLNNEETKTIKGLNDARVLEAIFKSGVLCLMSMSDANAFYKYRSHVNIIDVNNINEPDKALSLISTPIKNNINKFHTVIILSRGDYTGLASDFEFGDFETVDLSRCVGITDISSRNFKKSKKLKKVILPETVKSIGEEVFENCENLESVNLPSSLTIIRHKAFFECNKVVLTKNRGQKINVTKDDASFLKRHISVIGEESPIKEESLELNEALSPSMPEWLKGLMNSKISQRRGADDKLSKLLNDVMYINLEKAEFIDIDASVKKSEKLNYCTYPYIGIFDIVYRGWGEERRFVFVKNFVDGSVIGDVYAPWLQQTKWLSETSINSILQYSQHVCFIDTSKEENTIHAIRTSRYDAKKGSIDRIPDNKRKDVLNRINNNRYLTQPVTIDKSGYLVDPEKQVSELNNLHRENYSKALKAYYQRLKTLKKEIISEYSNVDIKDPRGDEDSLMSIFSSLNSACNRYRDVVRRIDAILSIKDKKEKKVRLDSFFAQKDNEMMKLRKDLLNLESQMRKHSFEVIESIKEEFKNWCGEELYNEAMGKFGDKLDAYEYRRFMSKDIDYLKECLKRIK